MRLILEVKVSRDAARELEEAAAWYEKEESGLGERLIDAFEHATQLCSDGEAATGKLSP